MTAPCARCDGLAPEGVDALETIGGSHIPTDFPWAELRRCPGCGAHFAYTRDHDNEIGYVPCPPTLERLDHARALALATDALVDARRLHAHFAPLADAYSRGVAGRYEAEIGRLEREAAALRAGGAGGTGPR